MDEAPDVTAPTTEADTASLEEAPTAPVESQPEVATLDDALEASFEGSDDADASAETDQPESPTYKITVDGEEIEVPLDELLNGYQRQADYTRKTQELAQQRERLTALDTFEEYLRVDPEGALQRLATAYGVNLGATQPEPTAQDYLDGVLGDEQDPVMQKLSQLEAKLTAQEAAEAQRAEAARLAAIDAQIEGLEQSDPDLDGTALLKYAVDNHIGDLQAAYKAFKYEQMQEAASNAAELAAQQKRDAKRQAPPVEGGSSRNTAVKAGPSKVASLDDAFERAMADLTG